MRKGEIMKEVFFWLTRRKFLRQFFYKEKSFNSLRQHFNDEQEEEAERLHASAIGSKRNVEESFACP